MCTYFVHECVLGKNGKKRPAWADPEYNGILPNKFLQELKSRGTYFTGNLTPLGEVLEFDEYNRPINPTHAQINCNGRGTLGKWGPNQAADPIAIRKHRNRYYVLVIKRQDTGMYALPGGMVDEGEIVTETIVRELQEEAADVDHDNLAKVVHENGQCLFKGINVSDPRNTRNAWMETVVYMFFVPRWMCETMKLRPEYGETTDSRWLQIDASVTNLYADHGSYLLRAAKEIGVDIHKSWWNVFIGYSFLDTEEYIRDISICAVKILTALLLLCINFAYQATHMTSLHMDQ